eukprot:gene14516-17618_t
MKSFKTLVCVTSFALCFGAASMAGAATISPAGAAFTTAAGGTITVKSPSSFGAAVTCNISFTGAVNAAGTGASINSAAVSGSNPLCNLPTMTNLPWVLTPPATGISPGTATNVGYKIAASVQAANRWPVVAPWLITRGKAGASEEALVRCRLTKSADNMAVTPGE